MFKWIKSLFATEDDGVYKRDLLFPDSEISRAIITEIYIATGEQIRKGWFFIEGKSGIAYSDGLLISQYGDTINLIEFNPIGCSFPDEEDDYLKRTLVDEGYILNE